MPKDLVLLRYTDKNGRRLAALCRPSTGMDVLRSVIGAETEDDQQWFDEEHDSAVVIDTHGAVLITDSEDMTLLSWWFAMAAEWLKQHGG